MAKAETIRGVDVAVAIVVDAEGNVLLEYDEAWRTFSFPMSKIRERETGEHAAGRAIAEAIGCLSRPEQVLELPAFGISGLDGEVKRYYFQCYFCRLTERAAMCSQKPVQWVPMELIRDPQVEPVPLTARQLARALVTQTDLFQQ